MARYIVAVFLLGASAQLCAAYSLPEVICDERSRLVERLLLPHGAERQGRGTRGPDAILEVWAVPRSGEWTLVQSYPTGQACIIAMGEAWEAERRVQDPA